MAKIGQFIENALCDGVRGMQFIETMVEAGYNDNVKWQKWID